MDIAVESIPAAVEEVAGLMDDFDKALGSAIRAAARLQDRGVAVAEKVGIRAPFLAEILEAAARVSSGLAEVSKDAKQTHLALHAAKKELGEGPQRTGGGFGKQD